MLAVAAMVPGTVLAIARATADRTFHARMATANLYRLRLCRRTSLWTLSFHPSAHPSVPVDEHLGVE